MFSPGDMSSSVFVFVFVFEFLHLPVYVYLTLSLILCIYIGICIFRVFVSHLKAVFVQLDEPGCLADNHFMACARN